MHNGSYSYDGAGRLDQCIDSATGLNEIYTWNADGTLASMPGPGYTREFTYNEEAQLLGISHSGTLAYQYAYGADGNRRWSKDIANDLWTWYPCGVACGAGEMVEETSDLTGSNWTTSGQYLRAGGGCSSLLIRRKSTTDDEYHHADLVGRNSSFTNSTSQIIGSILFNHFGVQQTANGSIDTPFLYFMLANDDMIYAKGAYVNVNRAIVLQAQYPGVSPASPGICSDYNNDCISICGIELAACYSIALAIYVQTLPTCDATVVLGPWAYVACVSLVTLYFVIEMGLCTMTGDICFARCKNQENKCVGLPLVPVPLY